jgi:hypothetical protein
LLFVWKPSDGVAAGKGGSYGWRSRAAIDIASDAGHFSDQSVSVDSCDIGGLLDQGRDSGISFAWEYSRMERIRKQV